MKRIFLIVLDSVGIGALPDAGSYGDAGSHTLAAVSSSPLFHVPNMRRLGLYGIDGANLGEADMSPDGNYGRFAELSAGKDTTTGHWEIAGLVSSKAMPVFPDGFPDALIGELSKRTGRHILCNKPYSGTEVIRDFGEEHQKTGALIVYTSADSVLQIAAHEEVIPRKELYEICEAARELCQGEWGVGRVIARPFVGRPGSYERTAGRHDYSLVPPGLTMLDQIVSAGMDVLAVGKIHDIFAGKGITERVATASNEEGIDRVLQYMRRDFTGICFANLVDYDMLYGHRNDVDGYAGALTAFDRRLPELSENLWEEDVLMITADHGCDPSTPSTDHSREYVPLLMCGPGLAKGVNLGTRNSFADMGATVLEALGIRPLIAGESFFSDVKLD